MRIERYLGLSAAANPGKTALITDRRRLRYGELDDLSDRLANALAENGVRRDDRVLVFMDNCWEVAVSIFAVLKAGAVFCLVNASTKADKLAYIVANSGAAAVLTQARLMPVVSSTLTGRDGVFVACAHGPDEQAPPGAVSLAQCLANEARPPAHGGIDFDLAMLVYTSGSTGRPKGVMMSHGNCNAAAKSITTYLQNTADDVILNVLPLAFDYGLYQLLMAIRLGATLVLEKSFAFPQAIFERIREERVTGLPLVPTMAAMILQMRGLEPGFLPSLRYVTNTAAALPTAHIERLRALFPGVQFYSMYGLTECKRCTYLPPEQLDRRPGSVGIAIPDTEVMVLDDNGKPVPPGVAGELVVRGPHVMRGYWRDEAATARVLRPGPNPWETVLYTGDVFTTDADGYLYFVGRKEDIIKTRGEKVAPKEVEAVLHAHPAVAEAVVIGLPDPILGQAVGAIVVRSDPELSERDVIRHCARHLEDFMVPKLVEFRPELPKTETGKVSRRLAAETVQAFA